MEACEADHLRDDLERRLRFEGELELADKLAKCGVPYGLTCTHCGNQHEVPTRCKRKWCPACAKQLAARRSARLQGAAKEMRWPLFVTLTQPNSDDPESIRHLRRAFGKLRHRKLWTTRTVGGVAAIEVTNIGNGWHPHLHSLIDCEWLAHKTPPPRANHSAAQKRARYRAAKDELILVWRKCLGTEEAIVHVKRTTEADIIKEVIKYSVKGSDLIDSPDPIGDLIRVLEMTRLVTTFGTFYGRGREFDALAAADNPGCEQCGEQGCQMPTELVHRLAS